MSTDTSEKAYQKDIYTYLESTGYVKRTTKDYEVNTCLDIELVLRFIQSTQPKAWKNFENVFKENAPEKFIASLVHNIDKNGTIEVLRKGFKDAGTKFKLFYPKPNNNLNPDLEEKFNQNIYSVIDELEYEDKEHGNRLDLVIFINGIPISTIELKDTFSQGVENAIKQYKYDRDPREHLFKKCLIHFAMSDEKIFMTTKLDGEKTRFLPFNKGITNPKVEGNYKTSYLYTDILQKNQLSKLLNNFIFKEEDIVIFPRFHQLDCVNLLLKNPQPGHNYLIQHSAGSGKTKTIAWLAHGLLNKFNDDKRIYDMVIVVSDRKVIDRQLQDQVFAIQKKIGVVEKIEKDSSQLAEAIKSGTNIVVTTLQKFPFIIDKVQDVENRKYAVIVDEAHSSQTGTLAMDLLIGLGDKIDESEFDEVEDSVDRELLKKLAKVRNTSNISFFAFTATPKSKTLEKFGYKDEFGEFRPHHLYSMKQAIEEGFILDVLENYLTYPTYFKLVKTVEEDPRFDESKAKRILKKFVDMHPHAINLKSEIILDHLMNSTIHKIDGKGKAMLVCNSRKQAVLYKLQIDRLIEQKKLPIKTLVAFTGTIEQDTKEYNESNMNNIGTKSIKEAFKEDDYKLLIVANKFQTGFDEPLLHTMYVEKRLNGVSAVQTLSRLNRIHPHKNDTLIIDFVNDTEVIKKAFEPYYGETYLSEETDYHKLYDLMDNIYEFRLFDEEDVIEFVKIYMVDGHQSELHNLLDAPVKRFKALDDEEQVLFKKKLRRYQSIYSFLSQLLPFSDTGMEKLFIYNKFLLKKLPTLNNPLPFSVLEDVDIDSYKVDDSGEAGPVDAGGGDGKLDPTSPIDTKITPDEKEKLSKIIEALNEAFKTDFSESDQVLLKLIMDDLIDNEELAEKIRNNPKDSVAAIFDTYFEEALDDLLNTHFAFFKKINENEKLKNELKQKLLDSIYEAQK